MKTISVSGWLLAGTLIFLSTGTGRSQDTGLDMLHDKVRVDGKLCMAEHFHDGSGSGPTRAMAMHAAIRAWADFTAWEYGNRWGRFSAALSKRSSCSGGPGNYSCNVSARPCRR
jgi:hypothetical protein